MTTGCNPKRRELTAARDIDTDEIMAMCSDYSLCREPITMRLLVLRHVELHSVEQQQLDVLLTTDMYERIL